MRISRTTVILLVANLIAFGLVWKSTSGHQPTSLNQAQLFPSQPAKLILSEGPERIVLEKRSSTWRLVEPFDWTANIWSVQRMLDELRFISVESGFDAAEAMANGSGLKDYGLESPRWTLKVTAESGATVEAKIGVQPSTRRHFLLTADGKRIVPLPEAMAAALAAKLPRRPDFRDCRLRGTGRLCPPPDQGRRSRHRADLRSPPAYRTAYTAS